MKCLVMMFAISMTKTDLERHFETLWIQLGGSELVSEYQFTPDRRWRFDFASPDKMLGIEIEGGMWSKGRHTRAMGYTNDCEKYNAATLLGWRVFRFTSLMFDDPIRYILPVVNLVRS